MTSMRLSFNSKDTNGRDKSRATVDSRLAVARFSHRHSRSDGIIATFGHVQVTSDSALIATFARTSGIRRSVPTGDIRRYLRSQPVRVSMIKPDLRRNLNIGPPRRWLLARMDGATILALARLFIGKKRFVKRWQVFDQIRHL